uniref:Transmembrane protein n=1 Tax=Heterorhabditis bacteriophora TaxID=37862 RepID=A0A1I7X546_HETBA
MSPPTPAQNVRHASRRSIGESEQPSNKRPRLVFTDIQKRTLQIRPITPPPDSPPRTANGPRSRRQPASMQHVEATVGCFAACYINVSWCFICSRILLCFFNHQLICSLSHLCNKDFVIHVNCFLHLLFFFLHYHYTCFSGKLHYTNLWFLYIVGSRLYLSMHISFCESSLFPLVCCKIYIGIFFLHIRGSSIFNFIILQLIIFIAGFVVKMLSRISKIPVSSLSSSRSALSNKDTMEEPFNQRQMIGSISQIRSLFLVRKSFQKKVFFSNCKELHLFFRLARIGFCLSLNFCLKESWSGNESSKKNIIECLCACMHAVHSRPTSFIKQHHFKHEYSIILTSSKSLYRKFLLYFILIILLLLRFLLVLIYFSSTGELNN